MRPCPKPDGSTLQKTWQGAWAFTAFCYHTFVAPWPPFLLYIAATAVIGVVTPTLIVRATSGLIDAITRNLASGPVDTASAIETLTPVLPWLGLLVFVRTVVGLLELNPVHRFMSQKLGLRSMKRLEDLLYGKAVSLRLEWFEYPRYYDGLQRAVEVMDEQQQSWPMLQLQNVVKTAFQAVGVLIALAAIHWSVPLVMLTASAVLLLSHGIQIKRYVDVDRSQTAARRRQEYWGKLLTERAPAPEVRLFGLAGHVIASWKSTTERMLREKAALRLRNLSLGVPSSLAAVALFGIVLLALVWAADAGAVTAGAVIGYIYVTWSYIGSISQLQWQARTAGEFGARVRYLPEFLSLEETDRA